MKQILVILISVVIPYHASAEYLQRITDLSGYWMFSVGDNSAWAGYGFNDDDWDVLRVPEMWDSQGYSEYDGYAWYRKHFYYDVDLKSDKVILQLGRIDDVDEIYLNGKKISQSGEFYPNFESAYQEFRKIYIPQEWLYTDKENVIAIRVFDAQGPGGIIEGDPGIYYDKTEQLLEINLAGKWNFATSIPYDNPNPKLTSLNWTNISVPGNWDNQGFESFDGYGIYLKSFEIPQSMDNDELYLLLGRIDDYDYVYLNGKLIGKYTDITGNNKSYNERNAYRHYRYYKIPEELIRYGEKNNLVVKVYDFYKEGGIIEGPVGVIKAENLKEIIDHTQINRTLWDYIFSF